MLALMKARVLEAGRGEEAGKWQGSVLGQFMEGVVGHLKGLNLKPEATES